MNTNLDPTPKSNSDSNHDNDETVLYELIDRLNTGDEQAVREVIETYAPFLRMIVRRHLTAPLRARVDSEDIVQSIWGDLVDVFREGGDRFPDLDRLQGFLIRAARHRLIDRQRQHQTSLLMERPTSVPPVEVVSVRTGDRPSEALEVDELWDRMLGHCPPQHRPLLQMKREGCTFREIATRSGLHPSSVRRIFYELAARLGVKGGGQDDSLGVSLLGDTPRNPVGSR